MQQTAASVSGRRRQAEGPTVYYDGGCPLCAREIAFYHRRAGADAVCWVDVHNLSDVEVLPGLSKTQALARFHVATPEGEIVSGGAAFARLWAALPGFRPLGRLFQRAPLTWLLDRTYDLFLKVRPRLQHWLRSRDQKCP